MGEYTSIRLYGYFELAVLSDYVLEHPFIQFASIQHQQNPIGYTIYVYVNRYVNRFVARLTTVNGNVRGDQNGWMPGTRKGYSGRARA